MERRIEGVRTALRGYGIACAAGAVGLIGPSRRPRGSECQRGRAARRGDREALTRTIGTIRVNRQTSGDVRATVHSFLAQAEYVGEIACGLAIAVVARFAGLSLALMTCGALFAVAILLIQRIGGRSPGQARSHGKVSTNIRS